MCALNSGRTRSASTTADAMNGMNVSEKPSEALNESLARARNAATRVMSTSMTFVS